MPYIFVNDRLSPEEHRYTVTGYEPPLEPVAGSPKILLLTGRQSRTAPNETAQLTDEMRSRIPHTAFVDFVPKEGIPGLCNLDSIPVVDEKVKNKLEELEPGIHEFFPVSLKHRSSREDYGQFFWLFVNQRPDIIDHDNTLYGAGKNFGAGGEFGKSVNFNFRSLIERKPKCTSGPPLINFKEPGYAGRHLWRATAGADWMRRKVVSKDAPNAGAIIFRESMLKRFFCSDEFGDWILAEGIRGNRLEKVIEEPPKWYFEQRDKGLYR